MLDFNEEDELRANTAHFKKKEITFNIRDEKRLESIMNFNPGNSNNKVMKNNLMGSVGILGGGLGNLNKSGSFKTSLNTSLTGIMNNKPGLLNNNFKELLIKKHKMDISLQKSLEREMKKEKELSLSTSLF